MKRARPNLRMLRLLVVVALLVVVVLGVRQLACAGESTSPTSTTAGVSGTGTTAGGAVVTVDQGDGEVTVAVGEPFALADMTVVITTLAETGTPTGARYPILDEMGPVLQTGESFYQAFARAENAGVTPMRVDPTEFFLDAGGALLPVDRTRTGPGPRSLLQGASFDFILTFLGPAGLEPRLVYRPAAGGTIIIEGAREPDGAA